MSCSRETVKGEQLCWVPDAATLSALHALSDLFVACSFGVPVLRVPNHAAAAARLEGAPPLVRIGFDEALTADKKSGAVPYGIHWWEASGSYRVASWDEVGPVSSHTLRQGRVWRAQRARPEKAGPP